MVSKKVQKVTKSRLQRFLRLLGSTFDPRALAHLFKIINYYNYTNVTPLRQVRISEAVSVSPTASFANAHNIEIGSRVSVGAHANLWAGPGKAKIIIGDDVLIAPNVMITCTNYRFNDGSPITAQAMDEAQIRIGNDVWIGYGAVILAGTTIGDRAIIGAGAIVRGDIPRNAIVTIRPGEIRGWRRDPDEERPATIAGPAVPEILDLIARELPAAPQGDWGKPLDQTAVDSFDLMTLRTAVESATGTAIPDTEWTAITCLEDIARLPSLTTGMRPARLSGPAAVVAPAMPPMPAMAPAVAPAAGPEAALPPGRGLRRFRLNMPQMALSGLSESWLFKEAGDLHWDMITRFLRTPSAAIIDDQGDRLYATFTRILLDVSPSLQGFRENEDFQIASVLERYGAGFFFATHEVTAPAATARLHTMSTFAKYGERGKNTSLMKGTPTLPDPDAIPSMATLPPLAVEYRTRRAEPDRPAIFACDYDLLPPHDINGVGLLYFAAYPTIFDLCIERSEGKGFLMGHGTVAKDICYFANSEPSETLGFRLHERTETEAGLIRHAASLVRQSDGKRMAEIVSLKRRND